MPMTSIWAYIMPRSAIVIAGRLPSKKPVSLMIATSAASRSRLASSQRVEMDAELDSSSPSKTNLRLTGSAPRVARSASVARRWRWSWPLSSAAPRASIRPLDDDRLERRRGPELERVDRLDVVVAVDERRSGRPRRGASRRRRSGGRRSPRPRRARSRSARGRRRSTRRSRRQSAACSGSAEMLGIRSSSLYDSRRVGRVARRGSARWPGRRRSVVVMAAIASRSGVVTG